MKRKFYIRISDAMGSHFEETPGAPFANDYGFDLFLHKTPDGRGYSISDNKTGMRLMTGETKREAQDKARDYLARRYKAVAEAIAQEGIVSPAYGGAERLESKLSKYGAEFRDIFGVRLLDYWDFIGGYDYGFNVVKFDNYIIHSSDGESVADAIRAKYGERAHDLVKSLLGVEA